MGTFTFKWEHPAEEVFVTGTFDGWTKSVQLEKEGDVFQKSVELKDASSKIYYKFVVDNTWTINETAPKEPDHEGNVNNFLTPDDIVKTDPAAAIINTVTPASTTAKMAGEQPLESKAKDPVAGDIPGGFPVTPSTELDKEVSVKPLPAADGAVNPITLAPGEKVPDSITAQDTNTNVTLDKESYEKADTLAGVSVVPPPITKSSIPEAGGLSVASQPVTINSVGPGATTAALAGQFPKESKVPEVVKESQEKAEVPPEASAVPAEVSEKAAVEEELKDKVPEAPVTSDGTTSAGSIAASAAAAGGAALAAIVAAKDALVENATPVANQASTTAADTANKNLPDSVKEQLPVSAQEALAAQNTEEKREEVSPEVPAEVKESIAEAGKDPEAAGNTAAVEKKEAVEAELLKEVKTTPAEGDAKPETKTEEVKEEAKAAVKAATPAKASDDKAATPANGSDNKASQSTGSTSKNAETPAADKKKKNRLSTILGKIKHKLSD